MLSFTLRSHRHSQETESVFRLSFSFSSTDALISLKVRGLLPANREEQRLASSWLDDANLQTAGHKIHRLPRETGPAAVQEVPLVSTLDVRFLLMSTNLV
nr:hypothetical protein CFP56_60765 [Quercus suber]